MGKPKSYEEVVLQASSFFPDRPDLPRRLLLDRLQWDLTQYIVSKQDNMPPEVYEQFLVDLEKLKQGMPLQYIIGVEWFYNRPFRVNECTLIPRPETELLVEIAIEKLKDYLQPTVLDIGTGSGVIGVTIALEHSNACVTLSDIDSNTLAVALDNAQKLGAVVKGIESDLFDNITGKFDCIVSNPPYISYDEVDEMDAHVLKYEPQKALFADHNGYLMYERFAVELPRYLKDTGFALFECGYTQARKIKKLFETAMPDRNVTILKDYAHKERIILVQKKENNEN